MVDSDDRRNRKEIKIISKVHHEIRFSRVEVGCTRRKVFSITGVHGSGKTTVYNSLRALHQKEPNWVFMPERMGRSPYPFGSKDPQVAFRAELWYFDQMMKRNELIRKRDTSGQIFVCDRSPICVLAYSYALCSDDDYRIVRRLYSSVEWEEDVVFYLEMNLESTAVRLMSRRRRNLRKWNEGDEIYVLKVIEGYERAFKDLKQMKTLNLIRIQNDDAKPKETIQRVDSKIIERARENPY